MAPNNARYGSNLHRPEQSGLVSGLIQLTILFFSFASTLVYVGDAGRTTAVLFHIDNPKLPSDIRYYFSGNNTFLMLFLLFTAVGIFFVGPAYYYSRSNAVHETKRKQPTETAPLLKDSSLTAEPTTSPAEGNVAQNTYPCCASTCCVDYYNFLQGGLTAWQTDPAIALNATTKALAALLTTLLLFLFALQAPKESTLDPASGYQWFIGILSLLGGLATYFTTLTLLKASDDDTIRPQLHSPQLGPITTGTSSITASASASAAATAPVEVTVSHTASPGTHTTTLQASRRRLRLIRSRSQWAAFWYSLGNAFFVYSPVFIALIKLGFRDPLSAGSVSLRWLVIITVTVATYPANKKSQENRIEQRFLREVPSDKHERSGHHEQLDRSQTSQQRAARRYWYYAFCAGLKTLTSLLGVIHLSELIKNTCLSGPNEATPDWINVTVSMLAIVVGMATFLVEYTQLVRRSPWYLLLEAMSCCCNGELRPPMQIPTELRAAAAERRQRSGTVDDAPSSDEDSPKAAAANRT